MRHCVADKLFIFVVVHKLYIGYMHVGMDISVVVV